MLRRLCSRAPRTTMRSAAAEAVRGLTASTISTRATRPIRVRRRSGSPLNRTPVRSAAADRSHTCSRRRCPFGQQRHPSGHRPHGAASVVDIDQRTSGRVGTATAVTGSAQLTRSRRSAPGRGARTADGRNHMTTPEEPTSSGLTRRHLIAGAGAAAAGVAVAATALPGSAGASAPATAHAGAARRRWRAADRRPDLPVDRRGGARRRTTPRSRRPAPRFWQDVTGAQPRTQRRAVHASARPTGRRRVKQVNAAYQGSRS